MAFGISFSDALTGRTDQQNAMNGGQTPIQDAVRILSLRIPSFVGARAPVPDVLLRASGGAGLPGAGGGLEEWLRRQFGITLPSAPGVPPAPGGGSAPPPRVGVVEPPAGWQNAPPMGPMPPRERIADIIDDKRRGQLRAPVSSPLAANPAQDPIVYKQPSQTRSAAPPSGRIRAW